MSEYFEPVIESIWEPTHGSPNEETFVPGCSCGWQTKKTPGGPWGHPTIESAVKVWENHYRNVHEN